MNNYAWSIPLMTTMVISESEEEYKDQTIGDMRRRALNHIGEAMEWDLEYGITISKKEERVELWKNGTKSQMGTRITVVATVRCSHPLSIEE